MVSIIIVTHNAPEMIQRCLREIKYTLHEFKEAYEVIVVSNDADPKTKEYLTWEQKHGSLKIQVIWNKRNLPFPVANNWAVKQAKGDYICLLNDDTIPAEKWLEEMLACMDRHNAGVVGAKLVYPQNGRVQHAGVCFNNQKQPFHILRLAEQLDPRIETEKEFQAVTFACVLVRHKVWEELGGLNEENANPECPYAYEDVDFCLRAKEKGYSIWYAPKATVGHFCATTAHQIMKKNQTDAFKNLPGFVKKWEHKIRPDEEENLKIPDGLPHIVIATPISENEDWLLEMFFGNLLNLKFWKGCITLIFLVNNSGMNFWKKLWEWARLYGKPAGFKDIRLPTKVVNQPDKLNAIVEAENLCREIAREINATHILFWEDDVVPESNFLEKLLKINSKEFPISCGVVNYKFVQFKKPMLFLLREDIDRQHFDEQLEKANDYEVFEMTNEFQQSRSAGLGPYRNARELMDRGIHEADAAGMGCTLMRREIADEIGFVAHKKGFGTQDLSWFWEANKKGYKMKADTSIKIHHLMKGVIF